jgi:hypothetical protein
MTSKDVDGCAVLVPRGAIRTRMRLALALAVVSCGTSGDSSTHTAAGAAQPPSSRTEVSVDSVDGAPAATSTAPAPQVGSVELYPATRLAQLVAEVARSSSSGRSFGGQPNLPLVESRRVTSGVPEVHQRWIDVTIVQAGRATLLSGGRAEGSRLTAPGELRGGTIVSGTARPIAAGDLLVIPNGVPHQYQVGPGDSIVYLTVKVLQQGSLR